MLTLNSLVAQTLLDMGTSADQSKALRYAEDGYRLLVHEARGLGVQTHSWPLVVDNPLYLLPTDWYQVLPHSGKVYDNLYPVGTVVGRLLLRSPVSPVLLPEPGFIPYPPHVTVPFTYTFTSPQSLTLSPTPDVTVTGYSITLDYVQEVPNTQPVDSPQTYPVYALNPDADLLLPDWVGPGLIAYITSRISKGPGMDAPLFIWTVAKWTASLVRREGMGQEVKRARLW